MTLLELMVVIAISSILLAVSTPAISDLSASLKQRTDRQQLAAFINAARQTAITRAQYVVICQLDDQECNGLGNQLTMFIDENNNRKLDASDVQLETLSISAGPTINWNNTKRIRFSSTGRALAGTLSYCAYDEGNIKGFQIVISRVGRIRFQERTDKCN